MTFETLADNTPETLEITAAFLNAAAAASKEGVVKLYNTYELEEDGIAVEHRIPLLTVIKELMTAVKLFEDDSDASIQRLLVLRMQIKEWLEHGGTFPTRK